MRKLSAIVLVLALCLTLAACGREEALPSKPTKPPAQTLPQHTAPQNPLAEQVIFEENGIKITVKGMEEDTMIGTEIRVLVENGTDRNIAFSGDLFVVNGITVPGYLYAQAAAGTKTNDTIELYTDVLKTSGITAVGTLRGYDARLIDTDTYETLAQVPMDLTTTHAGDGSFSYDDSGVELFQGEGITVIAQVVQEEFYGKTARFLVKNGTGRDIIVEAEHVSVNGYTLDAWLYDTVVADTVRYCHLDLFETGLAENGIDAIEAISFKLNFLDAHTYETITQSEQLSVTVKGEENPE